ncbi:hypothetical protein GCM10011326_28220 [Salipiger profundus]|nr:hypothetical protein GCM10011326_28220 [Salipiger profundus]
MRERAASQQPYHAALIRGDAFGPHCPSGKASCNNAPANLPGNVAAGHDSLSYDKRFDMRPMPPYRTGFE